MGWSPDVEITPRPHRDRDAEALRSDAILAAATELLLGGAHPRDQGPRRVPPRVRRDERGRRRRAARAQAPLGQAARDHGARPRGGRGATARSMTPRRTLLSGAARPIVLLRKRAATRGHRPRIARDAAGPQPLAPGVADGLAEIGVMLPYTPLHHLLLAGGRRPPARDDERQPLRRADRHRQRRGARPARRRSPTRSCCTTGRSCSRYDDSVRPRRGRPRRARAAQPRLRALPAHAAVHDRHRHPRGRSRAEEHVHAADRRLRVREPAHRRHGERRDARLLRGDRRALRAALPHLARDRRLRPAPGVPLDQVGARPAAAQGRRPAPPRAHRRA